MPKNATSVAGDAAGREARVSRARLIELLNEDLAREYQAIIAYVFYSRVIKGAQYIRSTRSIWRRHSARPRLT